ncbi:MAG: tetratricopeptide repeat protein [Elusimicrobia bacterium]|nr:tetratricopeptide repeat protein [Elusimicrobiota bacterium]
MRTRTEGRRWDAAWLAALLPLAGVLAPAASAADIGRPSLPQPELYETAHAAYLRGDLRESLLPLAQLLKEHPKSLQGRALSARVAHATQDYDGMRDEAQRAVSHFMPGSRKPEDHIARGMAYFYLGQYDKALEGFEAAYKMDKLSIDILLGRSLVWRAKGYHLKALADIDEIILRAPRTPLYRFYRGLVNFDLKEYDKAVADITGALRLNRKFHLAYGLLGSVFAAKGDLARAGKAYDKALELEPDFYSYPRIGRAALKLARGDAEGAFKEYDEVLRDHPRHFAAVFNKAEALRSLGKNDEALEAYRDALACEMPDAVHASLLGERLAGASLWREAIEAYSLAHALSPNASFLLRRSQAYEMIRDNPNAAKDLDLATSLDPLSAQAWAARGTLAAKMDEEKLALEYLDKASQLDSQNLEVRLARGRLMARLRRPKDAAEEYTKALELDPESAEAYNSRGALYANELSDLDRALKDMEKAVDLRPGDPGFQYNIAIVRLKRREYLKAIESLTQALALRGPPGRILQMRAEVYSQIGNKTLAMADMQVVLERDTGNASVYDSLGSVKLRLHDYESAIADLTRALEIDGTMANALLHRALAKAGMGQTKAALKDFQKALDLKPTDEDALIHLCWAKRVAGDADGGLRLCAKALDAEPDNPAALLHKGLCLLATNEPHRAIDTLHKAEVKGARPAENLLAQAVAHAKVKQYRQAHELYRSAVLLDPDARAPEIGFGAPAAKSDDFYAAITALQDELEAAPPDPFIFLVRGDAYHNAGQYERAVMEYTKALELDGTVAEAFASRASALVAQDQMDAASQDMRAALELEPKDPMLLTQLAMLQTSKRDFKAALDAINKAIKSAPDLAEAHLRAGNIHYFQRSYAKALESFGKAVKLEPSNPNGYNGVGLAYFALRKNQDAIENFSRAIALDPGSDRFYRNRASTYTKLKDFANAASDFTIAKSVSTDPVLIEEYDGLINESQSRLTPTEP